MLLSYCKKHGEVLLLCGSDQSHRKNYTIGYPEADNEGVTFNRSCMKT